MIYRQITKFMWILYIMFYYYWDYEILQDLGRSTQPYYGWLYLFFRYVVCNYSVLNCAIVPTDVRLKYAWTFCSFIKKLFNYKNIFTSNFWCFIRIEMSTPLFCSLWSSAYRNNSTTHKSLWFQELKQIRVFSHSLNSQTQN